MSLEPALTVLTASHTALAGLRRTIESVQAQTFRDFEHVIVDGGSADGTRDYLESLGDAVRWISEPDRGIADALNKGLAMARGDWVLVLHAEDTFIDPGSLARAAAHLDQADIVSFDVLFVEGAAGRPLTSQGLSRGLAFKTTIPHQGAFVRRALHDRLGGYDTSFRIAMDYEFFLRAYRTRASARCVPEILSRMPNTGVSSQLDWPSLRARFAEERRAQLKHCPNQAMRAVYAVYWPLYLGYRRARAALAA